MGRPRSFDEETVLRSASEAFVRGGYDGTSVDDLVQALALHRGSLYKAFGSKHGLFLAVLRHYARIGLPDALDRACGPGAGGADVLRETGDLDLLLVAALERGPVDVQVAALVRGAIDQLDLALRRGADPASPPAGVVRPVHALNLLGERLYERLHDGAEESVPTPSTTTKET